MRGISPQHTMLHTVKFKQQQKTTIASNNVFLLMLGKFKTLLKKRNFQKHFPGKSESPVIK